MASAALSSVTTEHPADPVNPLMNSRRASQEAMYSELWLSSDGITVHVLAYCVDRCASSSYLPPTVYVDFPLFHQTSKLFQP